LAKVGRERATAGKPREAFGGKAQRSRVLRSAYREMKSQQNLPGFLLFIPHGIFQRTA
jgi:hypothetical protein